MLPEPAPRHRSGRCVLPLPALVLLIQRLYEWPSRAVDEEINAIDTSSSVMTIGGLARIAHAGGNAIDRDEQRIANTVIIARLTHAAQQLHLHQVERIDIGVAHVDGAA